MKNNSEEILQSVGETIEYAHQYLKQQGDYLRLEAAERVSKVTSAMVTVMVLGFFASLVLVILSIAAGLWLGSVMGSYPTAFLIVAMLYAAAGGILYIFRHRFITNPTLHIILDAFFDREVPDEEEIGLPQTMPSHIHH